MRVAILGYGREGRSTLKLLQRAHQYKDAEFWIVDKKTIIKMPRGVHGQLGKNYLKNLKKFSAIFRSPGIPWNLPELVRARRAGVKFSSATKLFFEQCPATIVGITGTKGKGITATLLYQILKVARKPVFLAGNIGAPALDLLPRLKKNSLVVLELSSFQLQDLTRSPHIAAVLDVFPDHQDSHKNLHEYYGAKTNIARHQKRGDTVFFLKNNALGKWVAHHGSGKKIGVDPVKSNLLLRGIHLKIPGQHNLKNAVMAARIAQYLDVPKTTILHTVKNYRGMEHRLEFVRRIGRILFYNDSASTNPQTAAAAIRAFPNAPKILIAGGQDKNLDYVPLARALRNSNMKLAVLFGENKKKIAEAIKKSGVSIKFAGNIRTATTIAYRFAKKLTTHYLLPTAVLFSPGAASFDQFRDYADRGKQFKTLAKNLK